MKKVAVEVDKLYKRDGTEVRGDVSSSDAYIHTYIHIYVHTYIHSLRNTVGKEKGSDDRNSFTPLRA